MRSKIYKRGKYYHCRLYDRSGKLYRLSTGETRKRRAEQFLRLKEEELEKGIIPNLKNNFTFEQAKELYYKKLTDNKIKGWRAVECNMKHLEKFFGKFTIGKITTEDIWQYREKRKEGDKENKKDGAANATVQRELSVLKSMMRWAKERGKIKQLPEFSMFKLSQLNVREKYF